MAIVGAGMAGLLAAKTLAAAGKKVAVFDKGRGVGGRMATRRIGDAVFDHGAQYFTARDPDFRLLTEAWLSEGSVHLWSDGFAIADGTLNQNGEPRYASRRGMTAVPKRLASGLDVRTGAKVASCSWTGQRWQLSFSDSDSQSPPVEAAALILTAPVPQSLALLAAGGVTLEAPVRQALERIDYEPCLAALVGLDGASRLPPPGGMWLNGQPATWVADNVRKGVSPANAGAALTIHAGPKFSRAHWDADPDATARELARTVDRWLGAPIKSVQLHRWRYATPVTVHPERCLATEAPGPLAFAGDAFAGPRVEGAALSGLAAAAALLGERRATREAAKL